MYQPKISDDLIPRLYHAAQAQGAPMTRLVDQLVSEGLDRLDQVSHIAEPDGSYEQSRMLVEGNAQD